MDRHEAERYLLDLELFGMRFGLDRMRRLMTALGMPQRRFASIHVVGSNGKTSTVMMIAAILERHGFRTGSYTSPHLRSFVERIRIGGSPVPGPDFGAAVARAAEAARLVDRAAEPGDRVTQFEALTAAAYHELARRRVEVAVIEAGLGGRHDATSVIASRVQVLTGVALEHTRWLGPRLADIAREKLAVVGRHGCLVSGPLPAEAEEVAGEVVAERGTRWVGAPAELPVALRARGPVQQRNFALAAAAAEAFMHRPPDPRALERAAGEVEISGRLEVVSDRPLVIRDGAHNPAAAAALAEALPAMVGSRPLVAVVAVLDDKDAAGILDQLLPLCAGAVLTRCDHPRAVPPAALHSLARARTSVPVEAVEDPLAAVERAHSLAGPEGAVVATGSLHLVSDLVRARDVEPASTL